MKRKKNHFISFLMIAAVIAGCQSPTDPKESVNSKSETIETTNPEPEPMSEKKELLSSLIGEHPLQSISGFMGANTMVDYIKENGKWSASGSSLSGGMRELFDIDLSQAYLKSLQSMKIVVSEDLAVSLICDGKEYFKTPFSEEGMGYFLKNSPKDYSSNMSEELKPNTLFLDKKLYLFAKDHIPERELIKINIAEVMADATVIVYDTENKAFEMNLFLGECCDNSSYVFK